MTQKSFNFNNFLVRFILALVLVFASFNPSGYSWIHWFMNAANKFDGFGMRGETRAQSRSIFTRQIGQDTFSGRSGKRPLVG